MGNRSSKKKGKKLAEEEGAVEEAQPDSPKVEQDTDPFEGNDDSEKAGKSDKEKKKKGKAKKEKKKKEKKKDTKKEKKKDKKRKKSEKDESAEKETVVSKPSIVLNGDNCIDVTNFKGDRGALSEAVTVSVCIEPSPGDSMRGKENARPVTVYEGRSGRPSSPKGPGVSALMEKFGGKAAGTPSRPISYPAPVATRESPRTGELHREAQKKPFGFNRLEETPQKKTGSKGMADGNVSALKEKFGGTTPAKPSCTFKQPVSMATPTTKTAATPATKSAATPATKTAATPSKFGGVANKWQPGQQSTFSTPISSRTSVKSSFTPSTTTTTTKTTPGIGALRNRFSNNAEDNSSAKDIEETNNRNTSPEKKRKRREEEQKRAEDKENDKNRSPRRRWSPKKEPKTPSRESSPTKEASPRKRKSAVLHKFGGITRTKSREDKKKDADTAPIIQTSNKEAEEAEREKARQLILNRTSALIHGTSSTPKSTAKPRQETKEHVTASPIIRKSNRETEEAEKEKARQLVQNRTSALIYGAKSTPKTTTPSRVQFEESVPKRTRRDERPKERPKTEYNFQSTPPSRPKSMADTNAVPSPGFYGNSSPVIGGGTNIIKNPTTKTQKLLQWCQIHTQGYDGVSVSNFSSSWADGLAFCALVHKFHPTAFNYNSLNGSNRRHNFDLAFSSAEKFAKVAILLDTDDMIEMGDKPDWKCVFTYITSLYAGLTKYAQ